MVLGASEDGVPLLVDLRGEEDVEVVGVLVYVEEDGLLVAPVLAHALDAARRKRPLVDLGAVLLGRDVPQAHKLKRKEHSHHPRKLKREATTM